LTKMRFLIVCLLSISAALTAAAAPDATTGPRPRYNQAGELIRPENYREWIWLTSGLAMTYGPAAAMGASVQLFDNVFVEPAAWRSFQKTGVWPDGTMFVLEIRYSQSHGSINRGGHFQTDVSAIEMAVKDTSKSPEDKWNYYDFPTLGRVSAASAKALPKSAGCFACHSTNGAVDNTFTQFYPTALEIAQAKGTVKSSFHSWTPSPARVYHNIATDGWQASRSTLEKAASEEPDAPILNEAVLNRLGFQLLGSNHKQEALEVFRFNVQRHPDSANAIDSLAEALESTGSGSTEAIALSRRTLELLGHESSTPDAQKQALTKSASERIARLQKH
jgi:hypothetical protein